MTQGVRPSQFITTYGPGAILEGEHGPRIILDARLGLFTSTSGRDPDKYQIHDERMSNGLLGGDGIYRIPTNAEEGLGIAEFVYKTKAFPRWKICHRLHGSRGSLIYEQDSCPLCRLGDGRNAVGFVMACRDGHIDDVPWSLLVHNFSECKGAKGGGTPTDLDNNSVFWRRDGVTLSSVKLVCPRCNKQRGFGSIYYSEKLPCRGRHPHRERGAGDIHTEPCGQTAKVMVRQAANLRLSETRTLLSIRSTYTQLYLTLQDPLVKMALTAGKIDSKEGLLDVLNGPAGKMIKPTAAEALRLADWPEIRQAMVDLERQTPDTYHGLVMDEFDGLREASVSGAPPRSGAPPKSGALFELDPGHVEVAAAAGGRQFLVAPIQTLRAVTVQTGFRRDIPAAGGGDSLPKLVTSLHRQADGGKGWYPGVELYGEGLFIRLRDGDGWAPNPSGEHAERWTDALGKAGSYPRFPFRDAEHSRDELHPGFVWWHTLSHLLVRSIGEEAGYSPTAIRERIYFRSRDGAYNGGILLYATQPGGDGTLGGLIALAPYMEKILRATLDRAAACSGDPLCIDSMLGQGGYNGSSCYACSMNSETSCEHRNMWLDRGVLLDNLP